MCYESFYPRKQESEERQKAMRDADKLIEQARDASRKPAERVPEGVPAETEREESAA